MDGLQMVAFPHRTANVYWKVIYIYYIILCIYIYTIYLMVNFEVLGK